MQCVIAKNQDLSKNKRPEDWLANKESEQLHYQVIFCSKCIRINNIINIFFLGVGKFMPEIDLKQSNSAYRVCELFIKKAKVRKFKVTGGLDIFTGIN